MTEAHELRAFLFFAALTRRAIDNFALNCAFRLLELRRRQRE